jgi:hypothetical protein
MSERPVGKTKHGELTIDQLAEVQPGMARLMDELADRFWYMYYSAKGGNWKLAAHNLSESKSLFRIAATVRPKYSADLLLFTKKYFDPIMEAIGKQNWEQFDIAFKRSVEASDAYHDKYGFNYIRFTLPSKAPEHLDLSPPEKLRKSKSLEIE